MRIAQKSIGLINGLIPGSSRLIPQYPLEAKNEQ